MASAFSHAIAALGIGAVFYRPGVSKRLWVAGALCAVLPDLDVLGFKLGIHYGDLLGHRGLTHSLAFAAVLAGLVAASHGLLDAMTDGGLGVAFFAPFSNRRYFLPWTPIHVSPIGISHFFTDRGLDVLKSELVWVWIPAGLLALFGWRARKATS